MTKDVSASQGPWHEGQQSSVAPGRSQPDVSPLPVVQGHSPEPVTPWGPGDLSLQVEMKTHTDEMPFCGTSRLQPLCPVRVPLSHLGRTQHPSTFNLDQEQELSPEHEASSFCRLSTRRAEGTCCSHGKRPAAQTEPFFRSRTADYTDTQRPTVQPRARESSKEQFPPHHGPSHRDHTPSSARYTCRALPWPIKLC